MLSGTLPQLATCSYRGFRLDMGLAVRISSAPRDIRLPDQRFYVTRNRWLGVLELRPDRKWRQRRDGWRLWTTSGWQARTGEEFAEQYLAQLDKFTKVIDHKLGYLARGGDRLVLLCHERRVTGPDDCHRRLFAEWWENRTGEKVPELDGPVTAGSPGGLARTQR